MALAIVFRSKLFGQRGSYLFYYAINRGTGKNKSDQVELGLQELANGVNFIEPDLWNQIVGHGKNGTVIADMKARGALSEYIPDALEPIGSTSDFESLQVVSEILRNTNDAEWISRSISRDTRKEVFRMGSDRIKEIKEDAVERRQGSLTMEMA
ncbi:MAG TPA: hypothetical protein V6C57_21440 [Coleofasciculaceae cyanobacterium]